MSKSRKVLGALLAIVMVLSVISISAFAAGATYYEEDASYTQSWSLGTPVQVSGNQYKVEVKLSTNYLVGPVSFKLDGVTTVDSVAVGGGYYPGAITDKANSGLILMIPDTADTVLGKSCDSAVIATITYTTSAANGVVSIANDPKNANNPNGTLVAARLTETTVNDSDFIVGQTASVAGSTVTPPAGGDADLEIKAGTTGIVVDSNKTFDNSYDGVVFGIPAADNGATKLTSGDYYKGFVEATNGGSIAVVKSIYSGRAASWGTGTQIEVYNADGSLEKTYIVVLFGDVNGDSLIENTDIGLVLAEAMSPSLPDIQKMAANCYAPTRGTATVIADALYNVDNTDIGLVLQQAMQYDALDFAALAAKHAQYNNYYQ